MYQKASDIALRSLAVMKPPPRQTVSQWADAERRLSPEASAMPGRWKTSTVEYMREPMDCMTDLRVRRVVIMAGAQVAKTELLLNAIGWVVQNDPGPILLMQPTVEMAKAFSKERLAPMIRDTPSLRDKVKEAKSRDSDNTIAGKSFPGGKITMVGANAPAGLASRPIRYVFADEIDRYKQSAGTEGDPINLALKRTVTFWNRSIALVSTPGQKDTSRIEPAYLEGDQRKRFCPCPDCGVYQVLEWSQVHWAPGRPESAAYACCSCGSLWSDVQRNAAVRAGEWRATAPFDGIASFHIPGIMSPFAPLADGVREFLEAKNNPALLQVWVNTYLGETWEDKGVRLEANTIAESAEEYMSPVPEQVTLITAGVDVQDTRLEIEVVGWGNDFESWSIDYKVIEGDTSGPVIWNQLAEYLRTVYNHPIFGEMIIRATCVDSGYNTQQVYKFTKATPRCFAVKGIGGDNGKPLVGNPSRNNPARVPVYPIGTFTAKDLVVKRLKVVEGEPGYCHFPKGRDIEYYKQLTAESLKTIYRKGFSVKEWHKNRSRNEAFDCRNYATAALELLGVDLNNQRKLMLAEWLKKQTKTVKKPQKPTRDNFVDAWKAL